MPARSKKTPRELAELAKAAHSYQQLLAPLAEGELVVVVADQNGAVARVAMLPLAHRLDLDGDHSRGASVPPAAGA